MLSLDDRKRALKNGVNLGKKVVVYVLESCSSNQFRYRCKNICLAIDAEGDWNVVYFMNSELRTIEPCLGGVDIVVFERQTEKGRRLIEFIKKAKKSGVRVLFDLDDLVFDCRDLKLIWETTGEKNIAYWAGYVWGVRRIAKRVDGFLCTNDYLGVRLEKSFGKSYKVIRNSLNEEQIEVSEKCLLKKKHKGFVVGYFSGSPTHAKDFAMVEPELVKFLDSHDDAKLLVVGYMKFSLRMQKLIEDGKVVVHELVDYIKLQELMAEVDVSIAPLVVNDFTNCKSELKFFEAGVVETTTIASPTYAFKKAISDGENGFLAKLGEWYDKLEYLYYNRDKNQKIAKRARDYALKHYYGEEFVKEVEEAYEYFEK